MGGNPINKWSKGDLVAFHGDAIDLLEWLSDEITNCDDNDSLFNVKEQIDEFLGEWEMVRLAYENDTHQFRDE